MSTIAYDGKTIAFDTQCGYGNRIDPFTWEKVKPVVGHAVYAYAGGTGVVDIVELFVEWMNEGGEYPKLCTENYSESCFIAVTHDGELHEYERRDVPVLKSRAINAFGSGGHYAIGAMLAGASAHDAILLASRWDPFSNDDVRSFELVDNRLGRHAVESKG